jgi:leucyl/phenylalanyl-tRNA--protein transferase
MFSLAPDASKVALYHLCQWLEKHHFLLIDCQVRTEHLVRMGAREISTDVFKASLAQGLKHPDHHYRWEED